MKEYDLYLPLRDNDGEPFEPGEYKRVQGELLAEFDGVTYFPQANEGLWRHGDVVYRDEIVIYRVLTSKPQSKNLLPPTQGGVETAISTARDPDR